MSTINAQTIINEAMAAHAIAPTEWDMCDCGPNRPRFITFKTSARGTHKVQNIKANLMRFVDDVRKNAAAFGGGLIREEKQKPAIVWPSKSIALFKQCIEDKDWYAALQLAEEKLSPLFFFGTDGKTHVRVAPIPLESEPRLVSCMNDDGKWTVIDPRTMVSLPSRYGKNARSRDAQVFDVMDVLNSHTDARREEWFRNVAGMETADQESARAQWMADHGIIDDAAIDARIEQQAAQDVAEVVAQAVAVSAIAEAMAPAAETESTPELVTCEAESESQGVGDAIASGNITVYPTYMVAMGLAPACGYTHAPATPTMPPSGGNAGDTTLSAGISTDTSHLMALTNRLDSERARIDDASSSGESEARTVIVAQIEKEIQGEYAHLGMPRSEDLPVIDDDALDDALHAPSTPSVETVEPPTTTPMESAEIATPAPEPVPEVEIDTTTPAVGSQPEPVAPVVETEAQDVPTVETTTIRGGDIVLARKTQYGLSAYTFANRTQAHIAACKHGGEVIQRGRPFFVRIPNVAPLEPAITPDDHARFWIRAKSNKWVAFVYMIGAVYALRFDVIDGKRGAFTFYETHQERMAALEMMANALTTPPDGGLPLAAVDAPTEEPMAPVAECTPDTPSMETDGEFQKLKPFNMDPRKLLEHGVQAAQLIGLGVKYTGNISTPDGHGAITSVDDTRGDKCGSLRIDCTLEDGRVIHATPFYFTAELRPIMQFDGKMHGAPYLSELAMAATLAKSHRTSAEELRKAAHEKALIDLSAKYPQLKRADSTSYGGTFAAKNIRILLKEAFKGQKFSVTSDYSKVSVNWIDGPTATQVNEVIGRFDIGHSDLDTDYFYTKDTAFSQLFGGVQYLCTKRETSDALIQQAIDTLYADHTTKPTVNDWHTGANDCGWGDGTRRQIAQKLGTISAYKAPKAKA